MKLLNVSVSISIGKGYSHFNCDLPEDYPAGEIEMNLPIELMVVEAISKHQNTLEKEEEPKNDSNG